MAAAGILLGAGLTSCEGEKDLIIIEGNLPIKTSTLYMVGDATPNGWSIDSPTPLAAEGEDPLLFTWEGPLNKGEMKLCLTTGSWDAPFIRPQIAGTAIGKESITEATFSMHAGDPDDKWKVTEAGFYNLTFDLRNWTMSTAYLRPLDAPVIEPIAAENLFIVGNAAPCGWNIDEPTALKKESDYVFVYEGPLTVGELKACTETGSWDVPFVRPESDGCKIGKDGAESDRFVYAANPDNKWNITDNGLYRLTFDLENWTVAAEYTGEYTPATRLYIIGSATEGGWSLDNATELTADASVEGLYTWEGVLLGGTFKATTEKSFDAPFYRPLSADYELATDGITSCDMVYTTSPDDQWKVTKAGRYRLSFNISDLKFTAEYLDGETPVKPLYIVGSATPGGWSLDNATELTVDPSSHDVYTWEGVLVAGEFKASFEKDFDSPFYRPAGGNFEIPASGVSTGKMAYTTSPDDKWVIVTPGKYRMTLDVAGLEFRIEFLEAVAVIKPLYMIGTATSGGWSLDDATELMPEEDNENVYRWEGTLAEGTFKVCAEKDFSAPFYRPVSAGCEVSEKGVADPRVVFTASPDDQWNVVKAGKYSIALNIKEMTIAVSYLN